MSDVPNPIIVDSAGTAGSGYVLKAFLPGTTTSTSIAIAAAGTSPQTSITANSEGKWEVSGNEILPYIDRKHKWAIFANATDATANTPAYMGFFDNVEQVLSSTDGSTATQELTTALMAAHTNKTYVSGDFIEAYEHTSGKGFGAKYKAVLTSTVTPNAADIIIGTGSAANALISFVLQDNEDNLNAGQFGLLTANTGAANQTIIDRMLVLARVNRRKIYIPASPAASGQTVYDHSDTIIFGVSGLVIEMENNEVVLNYTGVTVGVRGHEYTPFANYPNGTTANLDSTVANWTTTTAYSVGDITKSGGNYYKALLDHTSSTIALDLTIQAPDVIPRLQEWGFIYERCGIRNGTLKSTTGIIALDYTNFNYGNFEAVEFNYTAANARHIAALGCSGLGPYFNKFDSPTFFGSSGRTQDALTFWEDASTNLANGPNANVFSNIKRGASLRRLINLISGTGNMFTNIGAESIKDALIVLNEVSSFAVSSTSTSTTSNTLTDTSQSWSTTLGDPLNFTNDMVSLTSGIVGETRRIVSNTSDTLTLDKPWSQYPGAAVNYDISESRAFKNLFTNIRQEGLGSDNPDGIRAMSGARGNEFSHLEIGSLGTGVVFDDQAQEQTNKVAQGDLMIVSYIALNPGAGATVEITPPRVSADGGIRSGSNMTLEYVEMFCPNFVAGTATATLTVDHGGTATGNGTESVVCIIDDVTDTQCYISADKVTRSTSNNGIFASLSTNANVNAAADFYINIGYRVQ
jgi:hypothetical protein